MQFFYNKEFTKNLKMVIFSLILMREQGIITVQNFGYAKIVSQICMKKRQT